MDFSLEKLNVTVDSAGMVFVRGVCGKGYKITKADWEKLKKMVTETIEKVGAILE